MATTNLLEHLAAAVQAELRKEIVQAKQQRAITKASFKSGPGARSEKGGLAGLEIPFYENVPHGTTALDPLSGQTSFDGFIPGRAAKMYVGLTFTGFTVEWEYFHEKDRSLPENSMTQRERVMQTYMQEMNWYAIGEGFGTLAVISTGVASPGGTITCASDATARGRSKGSIRLAVSTNTAAGKRVEYESYNTATHTKTATFYVTSKPSATQAVVVITDGGTIGAGDHIVKKGHYRRVPYGLGYHIRENNRLYQGVDTTNYPFLNSRRINGGAAAITPTLIDTAKLALEVRANDTTARRKRKCHLTHGHYRTLSASGYTLRQYNAEKGQADTSFGLPRNYEDEDTVFVQDADMEDAYIYMRDSVSYFEYRLSELQEVSPQSTMQYVGTNSRGSTEMYRNYGEACNLAWDARGDDGKLTPNGGPNSSVVIDNLAIPSINQVAEGMSLV